MITREQLIRVLHRFRWDTPAAAEYIGISYGQVYKHIKKFGLERPAEFPKKNWQGGKTNCKRGHLFTLENTFPNEFGYRKCRQCDTDRKRIDGPKIVHAEAPKTLGEVFQRAEEHRLHVRGGVGKISEEISSDQPRVLCLRGEVNSVRSLETAQGGPEIIREVGQPHSTLLSVPQHGDDEIRQELPRGKFNL